MSVGLARKRALRKLARKLGLNAPDEECSRANSFARGRDPGRPLALLDMALTHDSYSAELAARKDAKASNERLEFLGDAILGTVVAHALYDRHPDMPEGKLSRQRATLVSRDALAKAAERLDIGALLLLGRGERTAGGAHRPSILAGAFEALVGATYLAGGLAAARQFVERHHLAHARPGDTMDPKTALQEYAQARFKKAPHYAVTAQSGPPHARIFTVAVDVAGRTLGSGDGATKKQAEATAAREALAHLP